jgi:hypothetical protein
LRLFSDRQTFSLAEIQGIVPGVTAEDYKLMPLAEIVYRAEVPPDLVADWKQFAETVLANEAVSVWAPKVNSFDKPWGQAREIDVLLKEVKRGDRSPLFANHPVSRWFVTELGKAQYRENALTAFYADKEAALVAGHTHDDLEEVTLPYALPLWVEKTGRIVALKDVRHVPELLGLPPKHYVEAAGPDALRDGLAVNLLRESRVVEAVYREEVLKWRAWKESPETVQREALRASLEHVIGTDAGFSERFHVARGPIDQVIDSEGRMKRLENWGEYEQRILLVLAKRFIQDESVEDMIDNLRALNARMRAQESQRAKEIAKEELNRVAASQSPKVRGVDAIKSSRTVKLADLPPDMHDILQGFFGEMSLDVPAELGVKQLPLSLFPDVELADGIHDARGVEYAKKMIGQAVPPIVVWGGHWLDGRHRVWAAKSGDHDVIDAIDLKDYLPFDATFVMEPIAVLEEGVRVVEKVKHEDVGEKIGGARKDFHRIGMTADDLEELTDYERKSLVVKKNVWPSLDYSAMREAGVSAEAAVAIKFLKDALNVEPERKRDSLGDEPEIEYVKALGAVRDAMSSVKTLDEFKEACFRLYKAGRGDSNYITGGSAFQVAIGTDASRLLYDSESSPGWGENARAESIVPHQITREINKRHQRVAGWGQTATEEQLWSTLIKGKREKSEAQKEAEADKAEKERELHRPHLAAVQRTGGQQWRAGRDINAQDLIDHFGFRAIEFGNWLPQDERQAVLNMAFDSLCDLADALGIPPRGVSFDGELAVAFGSRGRGGKNAALAHFEPGRHVTNLTRLKGAGALAHEWFHALDWELGGRAGFLTEQGKPRFADDPMTKLVEAMKSIPSTAQALAERSQKEAEKHKRYAESWCFRLPPDAREVLGRTMDALFSNSRASMHEHASTYFASLSAQEKRTGNTLVPIHPSGVALSLVLDNTENTCEVVRNFCKTEERPLVKKEVDAVEANVKSMLWHMSRWVTVEAAIEQGVTLNERFLGGANAVPTKYFEQAKALDEKRSSPYWAKDVELFARAGAQYVFYELADKGVRSDYLVYGSEEERHVNHPLGNPNPGAQERTRLREHFSALIEDYRIRLLRSKDAESSPQP